MPAVNYVGCHVPARWQYQNWTETSGTEAEESDDPVAAAWSGTTSQRCDDALDVGRDVRFGIC